MTPNYFKKNRGLLLLASHWFPVHLLGKGKTRVRPARFSLFLQLHMNRADSRRPGDLLAEGMSAPASATVPASSPLEQNSSSDSMPIIAGVAGAVAAVALIALAVFLRRRRASKEEIPNTSTLPPADANNNLEGKAQSSGGHASIAAED